MVLRQPGVDPPALTRIFGTNRLGQEGKNRLGQKDTNRLRQAAARALAGSPD